MIFGQTVKNKIVDRYDIFNRFIKFIYSFLTSTEVKDRESFVCI